MYLFVSFFYSRSTATLLGTLKGKRLGQGNVATQNAIDRVWPVRCTIGDFLFPLGRRSAAAGLLYALGADMNDPAAKRDRVLKHALECRVELVAYARAVLGDYAAAEDVVQEAMLVVVKKFDQFEEGTSMLAW